MPMVGRCTCERRHIRSIGANPYSSLGLRRAETRGMAHEAISSSLGHMENRYRRLPVRVGCVVENPSMTGGQGWRELALLSPLALRPLASACSAV